jgi:phosphoribosylamine--glycine ligase
LAQEKKDLKILVMSLEGNSLDLALQFKREGAQVRFALPAVKPEDKEYMQRFGEGLVDRCVGSDADIKWADWVFCDDSALGAQMHVVKKLGVPCFGTCYNNPAPSDLAYWELGGKSFRAHDAAGVLERERAAVHAVFDRFKVGQKVESLSFKDVGEALAHLKEHPVPHVIKPEADGSGGSKTYVSELEDGSDAIGWLETLPGRADAAKIKSIEVEEKIRGVEVAATVVCTGSAFVGPLLVNFEHKRIWPGDIGPNCGEQGTVMFYDRRPLHRIRLFADTLQRLGPLLFTLGYRGLVDIGGIVNEKGFHPTEITPRPGYPTSYIMRQLVTTPWSEWMASVAAGKAPPFKTRTGYALGVVVYGEDYPNYGAGFEKCNGLPFFPSTRAGLEEVCASFFSPVDVRVNAGRVVLNGSYAGCVSAARESVWEASHAVYSLLDKHDPKVFFPGMAYRNDIGQGTATKMKQLYDWGFEFLV